MIMKKGCKVRLVDGRECVVLYADYCFYNGVRVYSARVQVDYVNGFVWGPFRFRHGAFERYNPYLHK